ncbi:MAG TPA: DUF4126 domain-containing protein [Candidatus Limnocylindria bacterium]|nr:DUF4126 domain-containing protein [Candidatus Limnocylindria bacterium]
MAALKEQDFPAENSTRAAGRLSHYSSVEIFLSICLGIGLSAACGFRVFVPLFCLSLAAHFGADHVHLAKSFAWIGSYPAMIAFGIATLIEIVAYYIPWLDNALDSAAVPLATVAGIFLTASVVVDLDPFWRWTLAVVAGGGIAASTQLATTKARAASSLTTGGIANPVLSTVEAASSTVLSVLAVIWPIVALVLALAVLAVCLSVIWFVGKRVLKLFRDKATQPAVTANP